MSSIGIDLGTSNSCVAARVDGKVEVFENDNANLVTPSCVAFIKEQILIGEPAKRSMIQEPENTIYSVKRIMGRKFDDPKTRKDIKRWQFRVVRSESGRPQIKISHRQETYNVEEISALVLDYMKKIACKKLDEDVRDAVVTVPAYFNHMQRTATKTAAEIAGINVLHIINEPTAAAISFGLIGKYPENRNILVYDFGGGTFDVTVLSIKGSEFIVKASTGNTRLGGDDLTNRMVDFFVDYMRTEMELDITDNKRAMTKLLEECEKAKKELSFTFDYKLFIENIADGKALEQTINRSKFLALSKDLLNETMDLVKDAIEESGLEKNDIDFVVPVGGSSRIPFVEEKLKNFFGEDVVKTDKTPEQVIAKGAAIYAAYLKGESVQEISEIHLSEVTPLSLGTAVLGGDNSIIIRRNTKIPITRSEYYFNACDYQEKVSVEICQGEEERFIDNEYLGEFGLKITPKLEGEVKIDIEYSLDVNGILYARATEMELGTSESTVVDLCGTLEKLNIEDLKKKMINLKSAEEDHKASNEAKHDLQLILHEVKGRHENPEVTKRCEEVLKWLESNPSAKMLAIKEKKEEIEHKMKAIDPSWTLEFLS